VADVEAVGEHVVDRPAAAEGDLARGVGARVTSASFWIGPRVGFLGTTLMAPPMAPSPNITEAAPRSTSMRSTDQVSNGKVTVPAPA
jgi:hypothetical protein